MSANDTLLRGPELQLQDGTNVEFRVEEEPDAVTVLAKNERGGTIGRASAFVAGPGRAAQVTIWVAPPARDVGVGTGMFRALLGWARDHEVRYLVGAAPADDNAALDFVRGTGEIVARRVCDSQAKFALLVTEAKDV